MMATSISDKNLSTNSKINSIDKARFKRLLAPKSIVVFGGEGARYAVSESIKLGFEGDIWAVHPTKTSMQGVKCYPSIAMLPGVPDAAYIAVNADTAIDIVDQLNAIGCGGAVLHASGFAETGAIGAQRQRVLVERAGSMPMIGPNCYGMLNCLDKTVLWPDQHGCQPLSSQTGRGVAVITQSGNIGLNITMQKRGLPLAFMFTMGNQANVGVADVIDILLDDPRVSAIGLHIEGLTDVHHFDQVCLRALDKKIPIIAIKNGRSETAAQIAMSHTSSLTGSDILFDALFERLGIARVNTLEEFIETLKFLSIAGVLQNNQIASMSCSGGEAGAMADLIEQHDLTFKKMSATHQLQVQETLNEYVNVENPLDYHTFIWGDEARLTTSFTAMMAGDYDATLLLLDWPNFAKADPDPWNKAMRALIKASKASQRQGVLLSSLQECLPQEAIEECIAQGVVPMIGLDTCLCAMSAAYKIGLKQQQVKPQPLLKKPSIEKYSVSPEEADALENTFNLDEYRAKNDLKSFGLTIPQGVLVDSATEGAISAEQLGFPVVVKAVNADIVHKTEQGGVKLNLNNAQQVTQAIEQMQHLSTHFLVEKMFTGSVGELIVGIHRDQQFGLSLVIGSGGVMVELLKDSVSLLLPTDEKTVRQAIDQLKLSALLTGFRGREKGDIEACVSAIMAIANFAQQHVQQLVALDVNPLMVGAQGCGVIAADAYICMQGTQKESVVSQANTYKDRIYE